MTTLQNGAYGDDVGLLQKLLNQKLASSPFPPLAIDNSFGQETLNAVQYFQSQNNLVTDGIVGPLTWQALKGNPTIPLTTQGPIKGSYCKGLDVSSYQGSIDWHKVKASGYDFVMIKATEGTTIVDSYFKQNWQNAKDAGLIRSPYHFFHPNQDPVAQANFFSQTVGDLGELPMMFDWELHNGVDQATECINAHSFIQNLTDQRKPIIYSYSSYFSELGNPAWLADYPLGLAGYVPESELVIPKPWTAWTFWQYSGDNSKDSVPGIQAVPLDFDYFNGTLDDLKKWAGVV